MARFNRKFDMNKTWLSGTNVLSLITTLVSTLPQLKRLPKAEALGINIFTYEKRVQAVVAVAVKLEAMEINNMQTLLKKQ